MRNHISHGNCYKLGKQMDKKIKKSLKGNITMYGYKCPDCGANLDPGEKCECRKERKESYEKK